MNAGEIAVQVAQVLLHIGAVGFTPDHPVRFKSGLISPVYVDNRRLPYSPDAWQVVIDGFQDVIEMDGITVDVIAGIEAAGIPHSAVLGYTLRKPSVFVRKQAKEHGTRSRVEGGSVAGRHVLLIEDLVTTGGSSLSGVEALRAEGAQVDTCLAIVSYGFAQAAEAFEQASVRLRTLTSFPVILETASREGRFHSDQRELIERWLDDPVGWSQRLGLT